MAQDGPRHEPDGPVVTALGHVVLDTFPPRTSREGRGLGGSVVADGGRDHCAMCAKATPTPKSTMCQLCDLKKGSSSECGTKATV